MDKIGFEKGGVIGYTTMVQALLIICFGVKSYPDNVAASTVKFNKRSLANIALTFLEPLPIGLLFALGSAGILSTKRRAEGVASSVSALDSTSWLPIGMGRGTGKTGHRGQTWGGRETPSALIHP